ncbi:MAG: SMI1/KNR4 family protein, partial [Propionibacteriaceae bacterium]|nr:SMI1/KNR4 family protein [Propionibacteriaceae bacterium]
NACPVPEEYEGCDPGIGVNRFIPLRVTLEDKDYIYGVDCDCLPVAEAACGNYVCLDLSANGQVFFWDHELPSFPIKLADSFTQFLDMLVPWELDKATLEAAEVIEVWTAPGFMRWLKENDPDCLIDPDSVEDPE